jgi:uncharacterized protein (DUF305 family)
MMSTTARIAAALLALAAAALLSSCTDPSTPDHADHSTTQTTDPATQPAGYNAEDIAFAQNMIPHHQQAIQLSGLVPGRSTDPQLIKLASDISAAQDPEVRTLQVFLVQWNENPDAATDHGGHSAMPMDGMVDQATMDRLASLNGAQFETLWLQSMLAHHQGAIEMANAEIANGANVDAIGVARNIVTSQQAEIGQMKTMLGG